MDQSGRTPIAVWLLACCGMVLLTVVMERDFGVHQLWRELSGKYPHFNFEHGYGLGILAVGKEQPAAFANFLLAANHAPHATRELFAALGGRLQRSVEPPPAWPESQSALKRSLLWRGLRKLKSSLKCC